ncbi:unnamed protein product [Spirodela intermedia]|uniref:Uncharacterized protein n=1 Tax=Spirodela intermedia TaxID=51605 RepID=A0A7I8K7U5_SPIIN|nr:unnamed protein product [Spirodela intermedia]
MSKHRLHTSGVVPFAWEREPGRSKVEPNAKVLSAAAVGKVDSKLPPPPCRNERQTPSEHRMYIPLPPCPFQGSQSNSSCKSGPGVDPFFDAYMECTRSAHHEGKGGAKQKKRGGRRGLRRKMLWFSCNSKLDVAEDSMVELPEISPSHHIRDNYMGLMWRESYEIRVNPGH